MSVTEASLETNFNTYIGDSSVDRISAAERLQLATESTVWLLEETGNDHMIKTYALSYFDNVHYYKVTTTIASILEGADLRRDEVSQIESAAHKSSRELAEEIGQGFEEFSWSIERRDGDSYIVVNLQSGKPKTQVAGFDSLTSDGGTWAADTTTSDASNVTADTFEFKQGSGSINFDIVAAQSGNNRATLSSTVSTQNLSQWEDTGSFIFWVYIPDPTYTTSVTLYWGTSSTKYWSATSTTPINGGAWAIGWNRVKIDWSGATKTSTPDSTTIAYIRFDLNYGASQADDTDYRIDDLTLVKPENLTFYYTSFYVGTDTTGATPKFAFTATSDIPYFSGQYDQYKYAVSHKMASIAFYGPLQNPTLGQLHEVEAIKALNRVKKLIPVSVTKEMKSFKVKGLNFARSTSSGRFRI